MTTKRDYQRQWNQRNADRVRSYRRAWKASNGAKIRTYRTTINESTRTYLRQAKSAPCMDCGGTFPPVCMDFDHRPGEVKLTDVSKLIGQLKAMKIEIAKCDLICANCHRIRTANRRECGGLDHEPVELQLSLLDAKGRAR